MKLSKEWREGIGAVFGAAVTVLTLPITAAVSAIESVTENKPFTDALVANTESVFEPVQKFCEEHAETIAGGAGLLATAYVTGAVRESGSQTVKHLMEKKPPQG